MAVAARQIYVLAGDGESHIRMIEIHFRPAGGHVAGSTIIPKSSRMGIVFRVTADAAGRSRFQIIQGARHGMACLALERRMRRHKWESGGRMIEVRAERLESVVTVQTSRTEGDLVRHEGDTFHLQVTAGTFFDVEFAQPLGVTILTGELASVVQMSMGVEGIAEGIVWKIVKCRSS
ncbi:MAG: hypothetical protein WBZ24_07855 [Anaerolineales bacterium]